MVLGRERRQERREDRQEARQERRGHGTASSDDFDDSGPASYVMREKLLAFGNDFEIKKASRRQGGRIGPTAFYVVSIYYRDLHKHALTHMSNNIVIV